MENLFEQINELYKENREWNYYDAEISKPFDSYKAKKFIKQYFEYGAKKRVILPFIDEMDSIRYVHTVSTFFIGLLIKREICPELTILSRGYEDYKFSYLWFLVCLFHDMGYVIENDWMYKYKYRREAEGFLHQYKVVKGTHWRLGNIYHDLGLIYVAPTRYSKFTVSSKEHWLSDRIFRGIEFNNGVIIEKAMYKRKTVLNYLEYCKMTKGIRHYDHGIVGGLWLYDNLMKNYYRTYREESTRNPDIRIDDFLVDGYWHFSFEQKIVFAYLADCVIAHNMWPAKKDTRDTYLKCGLEELVQPWFKKISFRNNPILFILAIADTIEPVKLYSVEANMTEVEIWKGINIKAERKSLFIKLMDDKLSFQKLLAKVDGLDDWIDVKVQVFKKSKEIKIDYNML